MRSYKLFSESLSKHQHYSKPKACFRNIHAISLRYVETTITPCSSPCRVESLRGTRYSHEGVGGAVNTICPGPSPASYIAMPDRRTTQVITTPIPTRNASGTTT